MRDAQLLQLTEDHASSEQQNRLLRCIGAGLAAEEPDLVTVGTRPGDRLLLCSDGVWSTVAERRLAEVLQRQPPQAAAERLVALANAAGGPDNSTAIVVHVLAVGESGASAPLPPRETSRMLELTRRPARLGPSRWPWLLLAVSLVLIVAVVFRTQFGFNLFGWVRTQLTGS